MAASGDEHAWQRELEDNKQKIADNARPWAVENGYPEILTGTPKQISWAVAIRWQLAVQLRRQLENDPALLERMEKDLKIESTGGLTIAQPGTTLLRPSLPYVLVQGRAR
jgi:hypothetical protein